MVFQDLCVVPLMLLVPLLAGNQGSLIELFWTLVKSATILFMIIFGARWLVPSLLHQVVRTRSRELFIITIILLCLGTVLLTSRLGLSLALGAFLAGLVISESEYAYQAISDLASIQRIVRVARKENPRIYMIVRTRYTAEVEDLIQLGANEVIPEEFETSIDIFARVLHRYQVPRNLIFGQIDRIRTGTYEVLRRVELPVKSLPEKCEIITDIETETYRINDHTPAVGRSIKDLRIRSSTGATVIAVRRDGELIPSPEPEFMIKPGDVLYLIGEKENVLKAIEQIESPQRSSEAWPASARD